MSNPIVKIKDGELKGVESTNINGVKYYSFMGIPYAEPPVGNLRFKPPVPKQPWTGILDATKKGNTAPQEYIDIYSGDDDCLFVNVYTPQLATETQKPMPVLVSIHGGGFSFGSGDDNGPDFIIEEGIILVTFNYRLGIMGFLCTDAKNATGDMGLKDQNLALKWIKQNISAFNGNPDDITLTGISAGSASVEYHILSSHSNGLFHKAILQSGSCLNPWARSRGGVKKAKRVAEELGYDESSGVDLFEFLNGFSTKELVVKSKFAKEIDGTLWSDVFIFSPIINELKDYEGFIKEEPLDLLKSGNFKKIPILSGICDEESMMMDKFYDTAKIKEDISNGIFSTHIHDYLIGNPDEFKKNMNDVYGEGILDFFSDVFINAGVWVSMNYRLIHNPIEEYSYKFSHDGKINFVKIFMGLNEPGACHGDDTSYVYTNPYVDRKNATETDLLVSSRMVKMWANFIKTGNPTPTTSDIIKEKWTTINKNNEYMNITTDLKMEKNLWPERKQFWIELYQKLKQY